jgi:hypothetical protein
MRNSDCGLRNKNLKDEGRQTRLHCGSTLLTALSLSKGSFGGQTIDDTVKGKREKMKGKQRGWKMSKKVLVVDDQEVIQKYLGLRSYPRTKEIPVIVLTTKNQDMDMFKGYEMGASYYLPKPFTKGQLRYGIKLIFEGNSV